MSKEYYSLLTLDDGMWSVQFGDHDRRVVEAELFEYRNQYDRTALKIISTSNSQLAIDQEVERINKQHQSHTLLNKLQKYIRASANGLAEGTDLLSALVNLVDTARETPGMFDREEVLTNGNYTGPKMTQAQREHEIVRFLVGHCQERL